MLGPCQAGSSAILRRTKKRRCAPRRAMKGVPGVMQLESKASSPPPASPLRSATLAACGTAACDGSIDSNNDNCTCFSWDLYVILTA